MNSNIQLISQGAYGCLFKPGINCLGEIDTNTRYITKIQDNEETTNQEVKIGEYLYLKNPAAKLRFAVIEVSCPISLGKIKDESIEKCELVKNNDDGHTYFSNKIRYVGKYTLKRYLGMLMEKNDISFFWRAFFESQIFLLQSILVLQEKKIVHFDLKENNVIIDDVSQLPVVIDFGISFRTDILFTADDYLKTFDFYFRMNKMPDTWTLEILLMLFVINNNGQISISGGGNDVEDSKSWATVFVNVEDLLQIVDIYFEQHTLMSEIFSQKYKKGQKKKWKQWIRKSFTKKTGKFIVEELVQFWDTWDTYSLSTMFFKLIRGFYPTDIQEYHSILIANILSLPFRRKPPAMLMQDIQTYIREL